MDEIKEIEMNIDKFKKNLNDVDAIRDELDNATKLLETYNTKLSNAFISIEKNNEDNIKNIAIIDSSIKMNLHEQYNLITTTTKELSNKIDENEKLIKNNMTKIEELTNLNKKLNIQGIITIVLIIVLIVIVIIK